MLPLISILPPCILNLPLVATHTPPPSFVTVLPLILPPYRSNVLPPHTYTPPPLDALLPLISPPYIVNVPFLTSTPQPVTFECVTVPVLLVQSVKVSLPPDAISNTGLSAAVLWIVWPFRQMVTVPVISIFSAGDKVLLR